MKPKGTSKFPSALASRSQVGSKKYILKYMKAMYQQWKGDSSDYDASARRNSMKQNRYYAEGSQDISKYKNLINPSGDTSSLNLDWSIVPIIPKFVDVVSNGILNKEYEIKATAIDPVSVSKLQIEKGKLWTKMATREMREKVSAISGADVREEGYIPQSTEELELYMATNFKHTQELGIEMGIDFVFKLNQFEDIRKKIVRDLVVIGTGATKVYVDPVHGVKIRYVDPQNLVTAYSKYDDYRDAQHFGEVYNMTISELKKIAPGQITEEQYEEMAEKFKGKNGNPGNFERRTYLKDSDSGEFDYDSFSVTVLDGEFIMANELAFEKKQNKHGGYSFHKQKDGYKAPKKSKHKRKKIDTVINFLYKGLYIANTDIIVNYGEVKNQIRPKSALHEVKSSYVVYTPNMMSMSTKSLVDRMKPFADQIQLTHLKLQQLVAKARPKGIAFELGSLEDVSKGDGGTFTPLELQDIYDSTGNIYYRRKDDEGNLSNALPITELENGIGNDMVKLVNIYNYNMQMIRDVTGVNEAREGAQPDKDALVGTQKLALQSSNNATRHLDWGEKNIAKRLGQCVILGIQDMVKYDKPLKGYTSGIGQNMKTFILNKDISMYEFSIFLDAEPDEEEKMLLEQNIQISISQKELRLEDAIAIRSLKNVKLANRMLVLRRRKYQQEQQEMMRMEQERQAQLQQQQMAMAAQIEQQKAQMEAEIKAQMESQKIQMESQKMQMEYQLKSELAKQQFEFDYAIAKLKEDSVGTRDTEKEDRKDERVKKQAVEQSKLVAQKMGERGEIESQDEMPEPMPDMFQPPENA